MKRTKYTVRFKVRCPMCGKRPCKYGDLKWWVFLEKEPSHERRTKQAAIRDAVELAKANMPSQVVIWRKKGGIQSERTYPDTTPRRKG